MQRPAASLLRQAPIYGIKSKDVKKLNAPFKDAYVSSMVHTFIHVQPFEMSGDGIPSLPISISGVKSKSIQKQNRTKEAPTTRSGNLSFLAITSGVPTLRSQVLTPELNPKTSTTIKEIVFRYEVTGDRNIFSE